MQKGAIDLQGINRELTQVAWHCGAAAEAVDGDLDL
jgi:hypothetical protein